MEKYYDKINWHFVMVANIYSYIRTLINNKDKWIDSDSVRYIIKTLINVSSSAGNYSAVFNASNLASGVYLYRIRAGNFNKIKKFMLLK